LGGLITPCRRVKTDHPNMATAGPPQDRDQTYSSMDLDGLLESSPHRCGMFLRATWERGKRGEGVGATGVWNWDQHPNLRGWDRSRNTCKSSPLPQKRDLTSLLSSQGAQDIFSSGSFCVPLEEVERDMQQCAEHCQAEMSAAGRSVSFII
jgi:hypothetical protein